MGVSNRDYFHSICLNIIRFQVWWPKTMIYVLCHFHTDPGLEALSRLHWLCYSSVDRWLCCWLHCCRRFHLSDVMLMQKYLWTTSASSDPGVWVCVLSVEWRSPRGHCSRWPGAVRTVPHGSTRLPLSTQQHGTAGYCARFLVLDTVQKNSVGEFNS